MEIVLRFAAERLVRKTVEVADAKVGRCHAVAKFHAPPVVATQAPPVRTGPAIRFGW